MLSHNPIVPKVRTLYPSVCLVSAPWFCVQIGQLYKIFGVLGTPGAAQWPGVVNLCDWQPGFPQWQPQNLALVCTLPTRSPPLPPPPILLLPRLPIAARNVCTDCIYPRLNTATTEALAHHLKSRGPVMKEREEGGQLRRGMRLTREVTNVNWQSIGWRSVG